MQIVALTTINSFLNQKTKTFGQLIKTFTLITFNDVANLMNSCDVKSVNIV